MHITKPECVKDAVMNALALGNSGRGVNESSLDAARKIYEVRTKVDQFFDGYGAEQVVSCPKLNLTIPCSIVPKCSCTNGAQ